MAKKRPNTGSSEVMTKAERQFWNKFFRELLDKLERPERLGNGWVRGKRGVWYEGPEKPKGDCPCADCRHHE
jgi:hypothetical protein